MAKKVTGYIKLQIPAGKATPAPPVGPALGQHGVNIVQFTKEFNARTADQAEKYYGIEKNKIDEIYGEDSIEVLYLEDRQMNSKIIYKEEGGWKCTSHSEIKCLYNRADFKKDNTIVVRECTITGELYISVICGKKDNKDFQISDTQNTIFTKKEFVNKNGEQISYNGYLGKEKPKNYVIHLDGEEISIDWNESDIMIV